MQKGVHCIMVSNCFKLLFENVNNYLNQKVSWKFSKYLKFFLSQQKKKKTNQEVLGLMRFLLFKKSKDVLN